MASDNATRADHVRIGPMSLFTLIVVICMAVLAVLTLSTANATYVMTNRQATATTELYLDEAAAQEFVAGISDVLASARTDASLDDEDGEGDEALYESVIDEDADVDDAAVDDADDVGDADEAEAVESDGEDDADGEDAEDADAIESETATASSAKKPARLVEDSLINLRDQVQASSNGRVAVTASMVDSAVHAEFSCENGRVLSIVVTIRDDATFRIDKWKMTAVQNEEPSSGNLWTGD